MKTCKQCGRNLEDTAFRPTKSRSKGIYNTKTGSSTICRECESLNNRAHQVLKNGDEKMAEILKQHYAKLMAVGHPPITAAARRLMGLAPLEKSTKQNSLLSSALLYDHIAKVRNRTYSSFDEADAAHRRLEMQLREAGLYEEAANLLDEWYMED